MTCLSLFPTLTIIEDSDVFFFQSVCSIIPNKNNLTKKVETTFDAIWNIYLERDYKK